MPRFRLRLGRKLDRCGGERSEDNKHTGGPRRIRSLRVFIDSNGLGFNCRSGQYTRQYG